MAMYKDIDFLNIEKNILLTENVSTGEVCVKKYISEAQMRIYQTIRQNNFSGVPKVIDIYQENDYFVLIEEYIKGRTLQNILDENIPCTPDFVKLLVLSLCRTLAPIHRQNIIHRDITASNIICTSSLEFYLIDFGNSRTYKDNQSTDTEYIGTQNYAAPEQFGFGQSSRQTDIYSIGVLMNVLLTGGSFLYEKRAEGELAKVIKRAANVNPKKRYANVSRLAAAVKVAMSNITLKVIALLLIPIETYIIFGFIFGGIALITSSDTIPVSRIKNPSEPIAASTADEREYRRWRTIEDSIADGNYDEAQELLNQAAIDMPNDINLYLLSTQNYYAQDMYDKAAQSLLDYCEIGTPDELLDNSVVIRKWLKRLRGDCSESVKAQITSVLEALS